MAAIPVTTGLQLLLDARTITGLINADKVASWADQSGQGNDAAQATDANRPTYRTNIFGTNPAVRFGAVNEHLHGLFSAWGTAAGQTMLLSINNTPATQTANGRFFSTANTGFDSDNNMLYANLTSGDVFVYNNNIGVKGITPPTIYTSGLNRPGVIGFAVDGTTMTYVANGGFQELTHAAGIPTAPTKYNFGHINAGTIMSTYGALFDCHFVALYNCKLSLTDVNRVVTWMGTEIGTHVASSGGVIVIEDD